MTNVSDTTHEPVKTTNYLRSMKMFYAITIAFAAFIAIAAQPMKKKWKPEELRDAKIEFGRQMFFDKALSNPDGQSCTVCHAPKTSFSDPNHAVVSEGMVDGAFVNRNSQSLAYVSYIPPRTWSKEENLWKGGFFWDGRSNTLAHQLSGPFFNPAEMNNTDTLMLIEELKKAPYFNMYKNIYGKLKDPTEAYNNMCESIVMFESSETFNEFSSKYDLMLAGKVQFNENEKLGMQLFQGKAGCVKCHSMDPDPVNGKVLFTNYGYYNIGVPRNGNNPFYSTFESINPKGKSAIDLGLGGVLNDPEQNGKFRVPTLRNVQYTGPYFHNGFATTLREAVHFMNTSNNGEFGDPEIRQNVARQLVGSQHMSPDEEDAIVAFLLTLTDGWEETEGE
ncbi:MAG: c-type cytochrome [Flavobacteriales bacterium]|nr:c-type cytochrome [Flavobacteriales bacterium]